MRSEAASNGQSHTCDGIQHIQYLAKYSFREIYCRMAPPPDEKSVRRNAVYMKKKT